MSLTETVYLRLPLPLKQAALSYYGRRLVWQRYATAAQDDAAWGLPAVLGKSWPELRRRQEEQLAGLLRRARALSPFWAERLAGIAGENLADLQQLPPLTKQELRAAGRRTLCRDITGKNLLAEHTSGSTGSPLTYYTSLAAVRRYCAFYRSFRAWHGYQAGERRARLGGRLILPVSRRCPPYWLYDPAQETVYLSVYHMSEETMPRYVEAVVSYGPAELSAYPSSLYLLADWCIRHREQRIRPRRIMTDAETLLEYQRATIEAAFHCRVTDCYGLSETGTFAGECPHGTLHVFPHLAVLEPLNERGERCAEGEIGTLHVTSLVNDAAPLIRYNTGDRGALGPIGCACGLQTPTLCCLEGRVDDIVTTLDGRRIGRLDLIFKETMGSGSLRECQVIQLAPGRFRFLVVPGEAFGSATLAQARAAAQARLGPDADVTFQVVDRIPRGPNGKFRAVVVQKEEPQAGSLEGAAGTAASGPVPSSRVSPPGSRGER